MTLPSAPNSISVSQINTEIGAATTTSRTLQFLNGLIKPAQRPAQPNMNSFRGLAYYQRNADGNCNNGNQIYLPNCACDCGNRNCSAGIYVPINCVNCDTQLWLQTDCNCVSEYNCDATDCFSFDCDCVCS